jgi:hypothetical protein
VNAELLNDLHFAAFESICWPVIRNMPASRFPFRSAGLETTGFGGRLDNAGIDLKIECESGQQLLAQLKMHPVKKPFRTFTVRRSTSNGGTEAEYEKRRGDGGRVDLIFECGYDEDDYEPTGVAVCYDPAQLYHTLPPWPYLTHGGKCAAERLCEHLWHWKTGAGGQSFAYAYDHRLADQDVDFDVWLPGEGWQASSVLKAPVHAPAPVKDRGRDKRRQEDTGQESLRDVVSPADAIDQMRRFVRD